MGGEALPDEGPPPSLACHQLGQQLDLFYDALKGSHSSHSFTEIVPVVPPLSPETNLFFLLVPQYALQCDAQLGDFRNIIRKLFLRFAENYLQSLHMPFQRCH